MIVLAHPLVDAAGLGVPSAVVAAAALLVVLLISSRAGARTPRLGRGVGGAGGARLVVGRAVGLGLLAMAILAGRLGPPGQLDTITTALVIGAGWPLLLLVSFVAGDVWRLLNPFDTLARGLEAVTGGSANRSTPRLGWVAAVGAVTWTWWLTVFPQALAPRSIALALGGYTIFALAGCLVTGRRTWLDRAEDMAVALGAIGRSGRHRSRAAQPRAVHATMGILAGGLLFGEVRFSRWWLHQLDQLGADPYGDAAVGIGFAVAVTLGGALALAAGAWGRRESAESAVADVHAGVVVALGLALAIERDRLWTSVQLLVIRAGSPFGGDVDLFGTASWPLHPWPFGDAARVWVQVAVVTACGAVALTRARRAARGSQAATATATGWLGVALLSIATA